MINGAGARRRGTATARRPGRSSVRSFLKAVLASDLDAASHIVAEELAARGSRAAVFADLIHPVQYELGDIWYRGEIGVADEHRATALVETIVNRLHATPVDNPVRGCRCVLAAVGTEQHVFGLQLLAAALEDDGWQTEVLGPRASVDSLLETVDRVHPQLVGLSAAYLQDVEPIKRTVRLIKERGIPVMVGGQAFNRLPILAEQVGADAHGTDARVAITLARRLAGR